MRSILMISATLALSFCAACSSDDDKGPGGEGTTETTTTAVATIEAKSGNATLEGTATFVQVNDGDTTLTLEVSGAPPGEHGAHIHEVGDCSAEDASSAKAHWNPESHKHGEPSGESHLGDLGNLTVKADGTGTLTLKKAGWNIIENDTGEGEGNVIQKAVVIHGAVDDFTDPAGNSGPRIGCGVIEFESEETTTPN